MLSRLSYAPERIGKGVVAIHTNAITADVEHGVRFELT